jgi:hypothetical protein
LVSGIERFGGARQRAFNITGFGRFSAVARNLS